MKNLFTIWSILIAYSTYVDCSSSDALLREYLEPFGGANLGVGDFEVVQFWHKDTKSDSGNVKEVKFKRSTGNVSLTMKEVSVIRKKTPVWLVRPGGRIEKADENIISDAVKFYEEPNLFLSLATKTDEYGHSYFLGSISEMNVVPLPPRTTRSLKAEKPYLFKNTLKPGSVDESGEFVLSTYHIIYAQKLPANGTIVLPPVGYPEVFEKFQPEYNKTSYKRLKRSTADVLYPEVLAVLDYNQHYTTIYEFRFLSLLMYTISFWNSVNLRYSTLKNPEVRLRLTGIVVNMNREALPFINDNIESNMLKSADVISAASNWVEAHIPPVYDIIMIQTNMVLCQKMRGDVCRSGGLFRSQTLGLAFTKVRCARWGQSFMVGITNDDMNYAGVNTAAHEVGHILGADHDTNSSPDKCLDTEGFIMSWNARYNYRPFEWSSCSKDNIAKHMRSSMGNCLENMEPKENQGELVYTELLPGNHLTTEIQCDKRGYAYVCDSSDICQNLVCRHTFWFCVNSGPASDGTSCPGGVSTRTCGDALAHQECRNGQCVSKDESREKRKLFG